MSQQEISSASPYSMTEAILAKRVNKENCGRISSQVFLSFIVCLGSTSFGTALGWSHSVAQDVDLEDEHSQKNFVWLTSMVPLGCVLGITSSTFLMKQMGPRKSLTALAVFYIIVWGLMLVPADNLRLAGRFFLGFLGISYNIIGDCLLQQTIHFRIKRFVVIFFNSSIVMGVLISLVVGMALSQVWLTIVCTAIPILHLILLRMVPESPVFLYATSHVSAAKSLAWYRGAGNIDIAMSRLRKDWDASRHESDIYRYMMFSKVVYKGIFIVAAITFFQVCSGYFIFMFFAIPVWTYNHVIITPIIDATIVAGCFVVSKLFWESIHTVFVFKIRSILISSCFICAIQLTLIAIYLLLDSYHVDIYINPAWSPIPLVIIFLFFFDMGLNYYPKILIYEYMPFQVYRKAFSIIYVFFWMLIFSNVFTFANMRDDMPPYISFGLMATFTYIAGIFCYLFVVEPTGKSLIQVQLEIGGNPIGKRSAFYRQIQMSM